MVRAKCEPITGVWGPSGVQGQNPGQEASKPERILHLYNPRSWSLCPKLCFLQNKNKNKNSSNVWEVMPLASSIGCISGWNDPQKDIPAQISMYFCSLFECILYRTQHILSIL